jgi:hypothetical protein
MDESQIFNAMAVALSVVAVIVSALSFRRQSTLMQHANLLPVLIDMFRDFRQPEFRQHLDFVEKKLWDQYPRKGIGIDDLPKQARQHVLPVMSFFGNAGTLVANGVVSDVMVASYMRGSALMAWTRLAPYIRNERERRDDETYYLFFEHLAAAIGEYEPARLKDALKLKTIHESPTERSDRTADRWTSVRRPRRKGLRMLRRDGY